MSEPKIEQWMIDAATGIDVNVGSYIGFASGLPTPDVINILAKIIAHHAPQPLPQSTQTIWARLATNPRAVEAEKKAGE